jgi:hypothetical protein
MVTTFFSVLCALILLAGDSTMATTLHIGNLKTHPAAVPRTGYADMTTTYVSQASKTVHFATAVSPDGERQPLTGTSPTNGNPIRWYSERFAADATIQGLITFTIDKLTAGTGFTGRLRARLYKVTAGGSDVESLIGTFDDDADVTTGSNQLHTWSGTPVAPVVVAAGERLIVKITVVPVVGSFGTGTGVINFISANSSSALGRAIIDFADTFTTTPNRTFLYARQTTTIGIGNFYDLITTVGSGVKTGVVNTVSGGTEIQWTRTAGGTALEWISPRFRRGWSANDALFFQSITTYALESNASANVALRMKVFRRTADGTETQVYLYSVLTELSTSATVQAVTPSLAGTYTPTEFVEDDRLVLRFYITNFGTMGAGQTATLSYDLNTGVGHTHLIVLGHPGWKAEGDPAKIPVPSGLSMSGLGNGQ